MPPIPSLPPIAAQPLSVVLLAHDAAAHVEAAVDAWVAYLDGLDRPYELILVDDASTDDTAERIARLAERHPRLRPIAHKHPAGEGAALQAGLSAARHPLLFYTLCDPAYQPADFGALLNRPFAAAKDQREIDHVHLMSGFRAGRPVPSLLRVLGLVWRVFSRVAFVYAPEPQPGWLGWRNVGLRLLARALFGVRYHDVACPFRLLRRDILARIPLQSVGPFAHVELLAKANFLGHMFAEKELPLPRGHHPPLDAPRSGGGFRQALADCRRLLREPDFGPPLPIPPPPGANAPG